MSRVLVVGRGFIGQAVAASLPPGTVRLVGHAEIGSEGLLAGIDTVVHAGRHPALGSEAWSLDEDAEPVLARAAAKARLAFVSLGTRKVYAPSGQPLVETDRIGPTDRYGRQKLALEHALVAILGRRLTRLRLGNVFGFERDPARRTFLSAALASLAATDEIRFDMSPFVVRDFLPVELCGAWIAQVARQAPGGVLNLGSGVPLPTGRLALWLIEGHGRGRLVVDSPEERDAFVLDTSSLRGLLGGAGCDLATLRAACLALGRRLRTETSPA